MSELEILFSDNHLLAVAKPAGVPMVADSSEDESLQELAKRFIRLEKQKPGNVFVGVVHRLDRPVSGVALFARTSKAAERLSAAFRERSVRKIYWAITEGRPRAASGVLEQWLVKDEATNVVRAVAVNAPSAAGAKRAVTEWRVVKSDGERTLVELEPETGRAHQLRVALASLGAPIQGDLKYGARAPLADRSISLHARRLEFPHPTLGRTIAIECPLPEGEWWDLARR